MTRRRLPILFWSSIGIASLFAATVILLVMTGLVRRDPRAGIAVIYAGVFFGGVLFLATPILLLADIALSFVRYGTWPWKPLVPERPDT